jgi:hypothetical protein
LLFYPFLKIGLLTALVIQRQSAAANLSQPRRRDRKSNTACVALLFYPLLNIGLRAALVIQRQSTAANLSQPRRRDRKSNTACEALLFYPFLKIGLRAALVIQKQSTAANLSQPRRRDKKSTTTVVVVFSPYPHWITRCARDPKAVHGCKYKTADLGRPALVFPFPSKAQMNLAFFGKEKTSTTWCWFSA